MKKTNWKINIKLILAVISSTVTISCGSDIKNAQNSARSANAEFGSDTEDEEFSDAEWRANNEFEDNEESTESGEEKEKEESEEETEVFGEWKGVVMTGDNSIDAFDNARKKLSLLFQETGVKSENIAHLSMKNSEIQGEVEQSSQRNLEQALGAHNLSEDDRCLVFMTSHGSRTGFYLVGQNEMSPEELDGILTDTCGDNPTVVIISACYSGIFTDSAAMQKPNRIILSAARKDRTSFGCSAENEYTFYDNCLKDNLLESDSWDDLYSNITSCISAKEAGMFTPSLPQIYKGDDSDSIPYLVK